MTDSSVAGRRDPSVFGLPDTEAASENRDEDDKTTVVDRDEDEKTTVADRDEAPKKKSKFPKYMALIIVNEGCERFNYYGLRAVLTVYLLHIGHSEKDAESIAHLFYSFAYFTPVLGAIISDSIAGKYSTIVVLSWVYVFGSVLMALQAIPHFLPQKPTTIAALVLIAFGTGGIKACVSAHGGDQFDDDQLEERKRFFSFYYLAINVGSTISTFIMPLLHKRECFNETTCFFAPFAFSAGVMTIGVVLFMFGKKYYVVRPPAGNVLGKFFMCIGRAIIKKTKSKEKREHWLDHADYMYDRKFIIGVRKSLYIMLILAPMIIFWALYEQESAEWVVQGLYMDNYFEFAHWCLPPDQVQVLNPVFILLLVPIFEYVIYPFFARLHMLRFSPTRMFWGGIFAVVTYILTALVYVSIEGNWSKAIVKDMARVTPINMVPTTPLSMCIGKNCSIQLPPMAVGNAMDVASSSLAVSVEAKNKSSGLISRNLTQLNVKSQKAYQLVFGALSKEPTNSSNISVAIQEHPLWVNTSNDWIGMSVRVAFIAQPQDTDGVFNLTMLKNLEEIESFTINASKNGNENIYFTERLSRQAQRYSVTYNGSRRNISCQAFLQSGGEYTLLFHLDYPQMNAKEECLKVADVLASTVRIEWQFLQYFVMSIAEVLTSITALEFSYSYAPGSMKAILSSCQLLTVSLGNMLVVVIQNLELFDKLSNKCFFYAGIMLVDILLFLLLAIKFKKVAAKLEEKEKMWKDAEKEPVAQPIDEEKKSESVLEAAKIDTISVPGDAYNTETDMEELPETRPPGIHENKYEDAKTDVSNVSLTTSN